MSLHLLLHLKLWVSEGDREGQQGIQAITEPRMDNVWSLTQVMVFAVLSMTIMTIYLIYYWPSSCLCSIRSSSTLNQSILKHHS